MLTTELEAELAKLTDELESECAHLEANEDRPIERVSPADEPAEPDTDATPEPEAAEPDAPADATDSIESIAQALVDLEEPDDPADTEPDKIEDADDCIESIAQSLVDGGASGAPADTEPAPGVGQPDAESEGASSEPGDDDLDAALQALVGSDSLDVQSADAAPDDSPLEAPPLDLGANGSEPQRTTDDTEADAEPEPRGWEPPNAVEQLESIDRSLADLTAQLMNGESADASDAPSSDAPSDPEAPAPNAAQRAVARARAIGSVAVQRAAPAAKAVAAHTAIVTHHTVRVAGPPAKAAGMHAARAAAPLGARVLLLASKPIADKPENVRSSIGWLALGTLFIALVTWFFVIVRTPAAPVPSETPAAIRNAGDPPAEPAEAQASASSSASGT